jgi:hypothetical protein
LARSGLACVALAVGALMVGAAAPAFAWNSSISGHVTNTAGAPLQGASVLVQDGRGFAAFADTDASGGYSFDGLDDGNYKVWFTAGSAGNYADQWWNNKPGPFPSADTITLGTGTQRSGIDAALAQGATISGRVTNVHGDPIPNICVSVFGDHVPPRSFDTVQTSATGDYAIDRLQNGDYKVQFDVCIFTPEGFLTEWFNDKPDQATADTVTVATGATRSGVDAQLESTAAIAKCSASKARARTLANQMRGLHRRLAHTQASAQRKRLKRQLRSRSAALARTRKAAAFNC